MSALAVVLCLLLGVAAGLLAGLLGVGGGLVIVAGLAVALPAIGVPAASIMHVALATSLASILATSLSSARAHARRGAVLWPSVAWLTPGLLLGGLTGAWIAGSLPDLGLRLGVAAFCYVAAWRLAYGGNGPSERAGVAPRGALLSGWGVLIGAVSALVGIGGGSMTVPLLIALGAPPVRAVGTSSACGFAIAAASASGYVIAGAQASGLPSGTWGYVYLPAAALIALASVSVAPLGVALAHRLRGITLKRVFAAFLALMGTSVLLAALL